MSGTAWPLIELASRLLDRQEREAVVGDLLETNQSAWRGFLDVAGLVLRRQALLWKSPRPWFAGFVAPPATCLLMGVSVSVTCTYQRLVNHKLYQWHWATGHEGFPLLLCHILLLITWAWSSGYVVGSVSRRTLWASLALSVLPSVYCLNMFSEGSFPTPCLFLFLLPAIVGVRHGLRNTSISLRTSLVLAFTMTALMISAWGNQALWAPNWPLILPAWYLVAAAWRFENRARLAEI